MKCNVLVLLITLSFLSSPPIFAAESAEDSQEVTSESEGGEPEATDETTEAGAEEEPDCE